MTTKKPLPTHLFAAYDWIDSVDEWTAALSDPNYAAEAAANAREHDQADVTESDLRDVIAWRRSWDYDRCRRRARVRVERR